MFTTRGLFGGVHVGINTQFGSWLFGGEVRGGLAAVDGTDGDCFGLSGLTGGVAQVNCKSKVTWLSAVLLKAGYVHNGLLVYGMAGWGFAGISQDYTATLKVPGYAPLVVAAEEYGVANGAAFGLGIEYALTDRIRFGIEYMRMHLGTDDLTTNFDDAKSGLGLSARHGYSSNVDMVAARLSIALGPQSDLERQYDPMSVSVRCFISSTAGIRPFTWLFRGHNARKFARYDSAAKSKKTRYRKSAFGLGALCAV